MKTILDILGLIAFALFLLAVLGFGVWWVFYSYNDCLKVGHSHLYCVIRAGGK